MSLNEVLKRWCDANLKPGMCYGGSTSPITLDAYESKDRKGKLVYQDGTACQASYSFHDVYLLDDGFYIVYVDCGYCIIIKEEKKIVEIEPKKFKNLAGVLDYLINFCGHDPNSTGSFLYNIVNKYKYDLKFDDDTTIKIGRREIIIPVLSKCHDNKSLIKAIESELTTC